MSRRKLLLADDSITIQKVVNLTFADEGIEVIAVGDGNAALDRMQETPPDLVMADVNMPGLSGYELCERVKQNERLRHIPVILLVGSFEPFDEAEAARVGADDFLTKPFQSIRQLVNKVTGMLETTENRRAASAADVPSVASFIDPSSSAAENVESQASDSFAQTPSAYDADAADDETIQTVAGSSFPLDEARKFESRDVDEDDAGKTQPLSAHDLKDFAFVEESARGFQSGESAYGAQSEDIQNSVQSARAETSDASESIASQRPAPPVFDFDDLNILDIPFDEDEESPAEYDAQPSAPADLEQTPQSRISSGATETEENFSGESAVETQGVSAADDDAEFVEEIREAEEGKTIAETESEPETSVGTAPPPDSANFSFPPEVIEAIAQKVAEKIAASAASDVAPRVADLIIQKMAEEKLKQ